MLRPTRHHLVDEGLEGLLLGATSRRPERAVVASALGIDERIAEEVLEATALDERVSLEVEEDVVRRGLGQQGQPTSGLGGEELPAQDSECSALVLEARLLLHAGEGLHGAALGSPRQGEGSAREPLERREVSGGELLSLRAADAGGEAEVVHLSATRPHSVGTSHRRHIGSPARAPG